MAAAGRWVDGLGRRTLRAARRPGKSAALVAPVAIFIGSVGAVSVFKAVYIDKRELTCACVGGDSKVPLGFVSLSENLIMLAAGIWMLVR